MIDTHLAHLRQLSPDLYNRDFLLTWQQSDDNLKAVVVVAEALQQLYRKGRSARVFDSGLAVSIFRDNSTRTRFSFASAASLLGLSLQDLDETKSQIAHGETVRETANMISFATEVIGIRDDMFLDAGHAYMSEVGQALEEGFNEEVLPQRPSVINLQCDQDHPTQSVADLIHLKRLFGSLDAVRGKRIAMTWAYSPSYGKPLSVPQAIINLMTRFGMDVVLAHPEGYDLAPGHTDRAQQFAKSAEGSFSQVDTMAEAFDGADIVYPKSWAPCAVMKQRTALLRDGRQTELADLERQCLEQNAAHKTWECTEDLMSRTREGKALYMHCLPADISGVSCEAGEVAASVFERYRIATYHEAAHKPFVIAAMMMLTRFEDPAALLTELAARPPQRRGAF
jgi:knotted carbamoyltransferase YgeW